MPRQHFDTTAVSYTIDKIVNNEFTWVITTAAALNALRRKYIKFNTVKVFREKRQIYAVKKNNECVYYITTKQYDPKIWGDILVSENDPVLLDIRYDDITYRKKSCSHNYSENLELIESPHTEFYQYKKFAAFSSRELVDRVNINFDAFLTFMVIMYLIGMSISLYDDYPRIKKE